MKCWFPGTEGKGDGDLLFNGYTIPVWEDEKISGMDNGNG